MERLEYDLLFRWFVGIGVDDAAWDHSVFSKNHLAIGRGRINDEVVASRAAVAVVDSGSDAGAAGVASVTGIPTSRRTGRLPRPSRRRRSDYPLWSC